MGQFEAVLRDTLLIVTQLGVPLAILFVIGYMLRRWRGYS